MSSGSGPRIVVGVSGSLASAAALRWAAQQARLRGGQLLVVHAWQPRQRASYAGYGGVGDLERERGQADRLLAAVLRAAFGPDIPGHLSYEVIQAPAERVLVTRSADADLLVLGSTSVPDVTGRAIGPVIRGCLGHAHCPVVIVSPDGFTADESVTADDMDCASDRPRTPVMTGSHSAA